MLSRLVIDGNSVYEIDEECERRRGAQTGQEERLSGSGRTPSPRGTGNPGPKE